jgi:ParB family chromosome partitioning protein
MLELDALERLRPSALLEPDAPGRPAELPLEAIDFDDTQPRKHFDAQRLEELARTIARCGVIQPISVHVRTGAPGRWVVNVGERRVRAARLAGLRTIPAFVEAPIDAYARVIENLAREDLSPFDLAGFIVERERAGESRKSIAAQLGKAPSFVTELAELADAPDAVRALHGAGRCGDVRSLYRLCKVHAVNPEAVAALSKEDGAVTRERIEALASGRARPDESVTTPASPKASSRRKRPNAMLVEVDGRMAFLPLAPASSMSSARVVYADGSKGEVPLNRLRLIQWTTLT